MKKYYLIQLVLFTLLATLQGQLSNVKFRNITITDGLSQSEVNCICQDKEGFIWIGTLDGLNRFDGYEIKVYRKNAEIPHSISNNYIQSVFVDDKDNLWVGTLGGGVNKYNKYRDEFDAYKNTETDPYSIASDYINCIAQCSKGNLLIGTQKGLSVLDQKSIAGDRYRFKNYFDFEVNAILEDWSNHIWLATWSGLYRVAFNNSNEPVIVAHYVHDNSNKASLSSDGVLTLCQDKSGNIWVGTNYGLNLISAGIIDSKEISFTQFFQQKGKTNYLLNNIILSLHEDLEGKLLIGTRGGGLSWYEPETNTFFNYTAEPYNPTALKNNSVKCFYIDRTGVLWIGTLGSGVNTLDLHRKKFNNFEISIEKGVQAPSNFIRTIYQDGTGTFWIGTLDGGLYSFDRGKNIFRQFSAIENFAEQDRAPRISNVSIYGKSIFSITEDYKKNLWIGTNGGINIINRVTNKVTYHSMDYQNADSLISNSVFSITNDDDSTLWIGTWGALHHFIPSDKGSSGRFIRYTNDPKDPNTVSNNIIRYIYNDPLSTDLWICTMRGGLNRLSQDPVSKKVRFIQFRHDNESAASISSDEVNMVLRSSPGDLWIATSDGLNKMIPGSGNLPASFRKFRETDGLAGNHVQSILEDHNGNLWLGTNKGLSKFDPSTGKFNNFDESDGLQSNEFSEHTCFASNSGELYFGSVNGFNSFFPDSIRINSFKPTVKLTNLLIFNQPVVIGRPKKGRTILSKSITQTDEITLSYKDNVFTIEFSAFYYVSPDKVKYAFMMEGFNGNWLYTDAKNRRVTFTNLKGGTYLFKVKASNNDGVWQTEPTLLKIHIIPPIWKTWKALFFYMVVIILITYGIFQEFKARERLKSEIALKNLEKEKSDELNQMKIQFFTNISHEFRTPLTLIISPIENLVQTIKGNTIIKEQLEVMYRNARYLLRLINELLDFRKTETNSWKLFVTKNNLVSFIREIVLTFTEIAERRHITFQLQTEIEELEVWFDKEMLVKIMNNLIYNAFKFTADGGQIDVIIQVKKELVWNHYPNKYEIMGNKEALHDFVSIKIRDNGIGISSNSIMDIFNRYYQVDSSDSFKHLGSGIGLALSKNLVLLSKGEIAVSSERGKGTEFIIRLPVGDSCFNESEKVIASSDETATGNTLLSEFAKSESYQNMQPETLNELFIQKATSAPLILIVEDNDDMRQFIKNNLERRYRILEAGDGKEGYKLAIEKIPDLIVSDVIMPAMGGIELCEKLKKNVLTSHIPIVLLTALSSVSDQIKGLETGADDYISKPFNLILLNIRIDNLIRLRQSMRERFGKEIETDSKDFTMNTRDQEFLDKAIRIVKEKITDPDLDVGNLSQEIGMSRMHLHRKLTSLTDQTPGEFIRTIRLKESARLLAENKFSVSEIAYRVGFSAPSYFTTCFGRQFGISPTEYIEKFLKQKRV
jgi:signal transduction histidine kinase/ligand-binding sensor domain-containing protein/DNA-binding response OmpR family regulator